MTNASSMPTPLVTKPSFKKTVLGNRPNEKEIKLGEYYEIELDDDEDEDDVIIDLEGSIPFIRFLNKVHNEIKRSIKQTVVVRLVAGGLRFKGLETTLKAIWKPKGNCTIMDL